MRLYSVDDAGRRGVVFLSLDADRSVVVAGARAAFGLPYRWARMTHHVGPDANGTRHSYDATLRRPWRSHRSHVVVRVGRERAPDEVDAVDEFVTARWGLHVRHVGRDLFVPNRHPRWRLRECELLELDDGLLASVGLADLAQRPPDRVAFSDGVETTFGLPVRRTGRERAVRTSEETPEDPPGRGDPQAKSSLPTRETGAVSR